MLNAAWRGAGNVANVEVLPGPMLPVANAGMRLPRPTSGGLATGELDAEGGAADATGAE